MYTYYVNAPESYVLARTSPFLFEFIYYFHRSTSHFCPFCSHPRFYFILCLNVLTNIAYRYLWNVRWNLNGIIWHIPTVSTDIRSIDATLCIIAIEGNLQISISCNGTYFLDNFSIAMPTAVLVLLTAVRL